MKIAIPVNGKDMEDGVCLSFGRAPYYLFYETDTDEAVFSSNEAAVSQGGAGIRASQFIADNNVKAAIAPQCGENAASVLTQAGIEIYSSVSGSIKENIEAFKNGELELLNDIHPGYHGHRS